MAIQTFDNYLQELGGAAQELRDALIRLDGLLDRHNSAAFSTLVAGNFAGRTVTKVQYDALMVTVNDLLNVWYPAGHGTNIEAYMTEKPA